MDAYHCHLPIHQIVFHLKPPFGLRNRWDLVTGHVDGEFQFAICWLSDSLFSWQAAIPFLENQILRYQIWASKSNATYESQKSETKTCLNKEWFYLQKFLEFLEIIAWALELLIISSWSACSTTGGEKKERIFRRRHYFRQGQVLEVFQQGQQFLHRSFHWEHYLLRILGLGFQSWIPL